MGQEKGAAMPRREKASRRREADLHNRRPGQGPQHWSRRKMRSDTSSPNGPARSMHMRRAGVKCRHAGPDTRITQEGQKQVRELRSKEDGGDEEADGGGGGGGGGGGRGR